MSKPLDWKSHFPYPTVRNVQAEVLAVLEANWDKYSVFVVSAPTALGKSSLAKTIMNSQYSVSYITPTNLLVDQFIKEFSDTQTLQRLDGYKCETWLRPCSSVKVREKGFCKGCPASRDLARAKYKKGPGVYNYHIYNAHKLYRDVLVVDEAHNLIPYIKERLAIRIWQHDYLYPHNTYTASQFLDWIGTLSETKRKHKKMQLLYSSLVSKKPDYVVSRAVRDFNGKGTKRGDPEERDCIELLPVNIANAPKFFYPNEVKKTILLSATINEKDMETLGLNNQKVLYIRASSPIPTESRPIIIDPIVSVNKNNMTDSTDKIATYIQEKLLPLHLEEKGVIHATYQMAYLLRKHFGSNDRFIFHTSQDKKEKYTKFIKSKKEEGKILVASGMYEGIDLPADLGRWQVLVKIPWMSLGSPAIKYLADTDPDWYLWETLRTVIQASGRICRTPEDFGVTYILDGSFNRLYDEAGHMMPNWFKDALINHYNYTPLQNK